MANTQNYAQDLLEKLKENYLSVALGVLVFLVAVTLIFRSGSAQPEEAPAPIEEVTQQKTYVVKAGESVSSIARDQLGSMDYADEIAAANNLSNANQIEVGQTLILPDIAGTVDSEDGGAATATPSVTTTPGMKQPTATPTQTISITGDSYTVKKGDTLFDIARRAYGDGNKYTLLISANKLRNPDRVEVGTVLKIPRDVTK